jgi:large subunit ribosomal protein L25
MSENFSLDVQLRTVRGKKVKYLRNQGLLPATVYGKGVDPVSIQVDGKTFYNLYRKAGQTSLIEIVIPGQRKKLSTFVHDVQRHPVTRSIIHADFRAVDLKVALTAEVPINLIGTSPLVERGDAVLNQSLNQIEVHALPANIPSYIEVDVSGLDSFDKNIHVSDLPAGDDYEIVTSEEELVVSLSQVRAAVEEEEEEEAAPAEPELVREESEAGTEEEETSE